MQLLQKMWNSCGGCWKAENVEIPKGLTDNAHLLLFGVEKADASCKTEALSCRKEG
ncbi:hypothetical protein WSS15_14860 [Acetobacter pasteurianus]|nr:hypothetical protein WSS15_14860 [Acetobacter pasteurianus]